MNRRFEGMRVGARLGWVTFTLLGAWLMTPAVLRAAEAKLPRGEYIVDNYVKVTGGKETYARHQNLVIKSTIEAPRMGLKGTAETFATRPDRSYTVMEIEGIGKTERGVSDGVVWELSLMTGPQIKEGEEKALMLRGAFFDLVPKWREVYEKAECVAVEEVEGKPCYKVVMTPKEGSDETRYYDKETGLITKTAFTVTLPMGQIPIELYHGDYREEAGTLVAHKIRRVSMGTEMVITIDSIQVNTKLPEDRFALPPKVKALVDKQQAAGGQQGKP